MNSFCFMWISAELFLLYSFIGNIMFFCQRQYLNLVMASCRHSLDWRGIGAEMSPVMAKGAICKYLEQRFTPHLFAWSPSRWGCCNVSSSSFPSPLLNCFLYLFTHFTQAMLETRSILWGEIPAFTCRRGKGEGWKSRIAWSWVGVSRFSIIFYIAFLYVCGVSANVSFDR